MAYQSYWLTSYGADQEVYATITTVAGNVYLWGRLVNPTEGGNTLRGYYAKYDGTAVTLHRYNDTGNIDTTLGTWTGTLSNGDGLWLHLSGSTCTVSTRTGGVWTERISVTDASPALDDGYIGFAIDDPAAIIDDFGGGELASGATLGVDNTSLGHTADAISLSVDIPAVQYARPDADVANTGWLRQDGATTDLYTAIDESVASDADYIYADSAGELSTYVISLGGVLDPAVSTGHVINLRVGGTGTLTVRLMQGAVEIASWSYTLSGTQDITETLTALEADAITDYSNLSLVFGVGGV